MKRILFSLAALTVVMLANAQVKFSVLGDSYSTFKGWIPEENVTWYGDITGNDVQRVEDTWWYILGEMNGLQLEKNNSWSGTTICHTGYRGEDCSDKSFLARSGNLGDNPDIIYIFGGTNDAWAKSPVGEYGGSDMYAVRPAMAAMIDNIRAHYPDALLVTIVNTELTKDVEESIVNISNEKNVPVVMLEAIDKQRGHPSISGMNAIARQTWKATAPLLYEKLKKAAK